MVARGQIPPPPLNETCMQKVLGMSRMLEGAHCNYGTLGNSTVYSVM